MKPQTEARLQALDELISKAISATAGMTIEDSDDRAEMTESMVSIVEILSTHHKGALTGTIATLVGISDGDDGPDIPHALIRSLVDECVAEFTGNLKNTISEALKAHGLPDLFDANATVREDIEREIDNEL